MPAEQISTRRHYSQRRGKAGIPPLKLSQLLGHMEIAEILRANGAEIEKKGSFSYLPKVVKNTAVEGVYHG